MDELEQDAQHLAQSIVETVDDFSKEWNEKARPFAVLTGSLVLQHIIIKTAEQMYERGSENGEKWIEVMYTECIKDAKKRWAKNTNRDQSKGH